jgi:hypothetical protein
MLKPKYRSLEEAHADYRAKLHGLDVRYPKDTTIIESKPVAKPAEKREEAPAKAAQAMLEHAPLSRYSTSSSALDSFRVLAGLVERENVPWDPGRFGTTKFNERILAEAGGFGVAGTGRTGSWGGYASGTRAEDSEGGAPSAAPAQEGNHVAWGKKISKDSMFKSFFFKHNRGGMPGSARVKAHQDLHQHHTKTAASLGQLSDSAIKKGDRKGAVALKHMQKMHGEIAALHGQNKHHRMFESFDGTSIDQYISENAPKVAASAGKFSMGPAVEVQTEDEYEDDYED